MDDTVCSGLVKIDHKQWIISIAQSVRASIICILTSCRARARTSHQVQGQRALLGAPCVAWIWLTSPSGSTFQRPLDDCLSPLVLMGLNSSRKKMIHKMKNLISCKLVASNTETSNKSKQNLILQKRKAE
jgi:hypothetical protein